MSRTNLSQISDFDFKDLKKKVKEKEALVLNAYYK